MPCYLKNYYYSFDGNIQILYYIIYVCIVIFLGLLNFSKFWLLKTFFSIHFCWNAIEEKSMPILNINLRHTGSIKYYSSDRFLRIK